MMPAKKTSPFVVAAVALSIAHQASAQAGCDAVWGKVAIATCLCGNVLNESDRLECYEGILVGLNEDGTLCETFCDIDGDGKKTGYDIGHMPSEAVFAGTCPQRWAADCGTKEPSVLYHFSSCLAEPVSSKRVRCMDTARSSLIAEMEDLGMQLDLLLRYQESREVILEEAAWMSEPADCEEEIELALEEVSERELAEMCQPLIEEAEINAVIDFQDMHRP